MICIPSGFQHRTEILIIHRLLQRKVFLSIGFGTGPLDPGFTVIILAVLNSRLLDEGNYNCAFKMCCFVLFSKIPSFFGKVNAWLFHLTTPQFASFNWTLKWNGQLWSLLVMLTRYSWFSKCEMGHCNRRATFSETEIRWAVWMSLRVAFGCSGKAYLNSHSCLAILEHSKGWLSWESLGQQATWESPNLPEGLAHHSNFLDGQVWTEQERAL